jgi:GNAT superfamily N-acetyltransferase
LLRLVSAALNIRQATTDEAAALTQIAHAAKRHWGYPEHWIQYWQDDLTVSPEFIRSNPVYVAEDEGKLLGFYALITREARTELDHLWVAPDHLGQGVGKELFIHAMQKAAGENISAVEISSDPNAEGFYHRMGARKIGEDYSEVDGQPRVLPRLTVDPTSS